MNASITRKKQLLRDRKEPMEVLWGAWVNYFGTNTSGRAVDIMGIYDTISKHKKDDFPFTTDLMVVLAISAEQVETDRIFEIAFEMLDLDAIHRLFTVAEDIVIPTGDSPVRWYQNYKFTNVEFREPGYYELSVLIDRQFKQRIPLWITAPKVIICDPDKDSTTEMWGEDLNLKDN